MIRPLKRKLFWRNLGPEVGTAELRKFRGARWIGGSSQPSDSTGHPCICDGGVKPRDHATNEKDTLELITWRIFGGTTGLRTEQMAWILKYDFK